MIRKFLADTVDLLLETLARLGVLRGGAAWWRERWRRRLLEFEERAENLTRSVKASHRMCPECRTLVPRAERVCPDCGASMRGVPAGGPARLLRLLAPGLGSASLTIVGLTVTLYTAMAIAASDGGFVFSLPPRMLFRFGAKLTGPILAGEWWRLVNPIFLHGSLLHIGFNAYALANLGPVIEQAIGSRRFLVVFMTSGIFSFVASAWYSPNALSIGASGALFGLIGFGIAHGYLHGGAGSRMLAGQLVRWAMFGVVLLIVPGIDHAAHAGGFIAGALFGVAISGRRVDNELMERAWTIAAVALVLLAVAGFVAAFAAMASPA